MIIKLKKLYKSLSLVLATIFFISFYSVFGLQIFGINDKSVHNAEAASRTITCDSVSRTLAVGAYTDATGTTFETGSDLILNQGTGACTFTINGSISLASLIVQTGVTVTHSANTTAQTNILDITTTGDMDIQTGASINLDGKGYSGGNAGHTSGYGPGPGIKGATASSGGGHGGNGASTNSSVGGNGYCDVTNPSTIGSGGGGSAGGAGGGLLIANISGTFTLNGGLTANGVTVTSSNNGGGAGGGIKITAGTISGTPTSFNIRGGNYSSNSSGNGGGGCALISYTASNTISPTASYFAMDGGTASVRFGGAGVVYVKQSGTNGDLYSMNKIYSPFNIQPISTVGNTPQIAANLTVDSITFGTSTRYTVGSGKTLVVSNNNSPFNGSDGGKLTILSGGTFTPASGGTLTIDNTTLQINSGSTFTGASVLDVIVASGGVFSQGGYTTSTSALILDTLTIQSGGKLTSEFNATAQTNIIKLSLTTLDINLGGSVDLDGKGYDGGNAGVNGKGPGGGLASVYGSGGGHGGSGGIGTLAGGISYCNISNPGTIGSGGGGSAGMGGGRGGGLLVVNVLGTFTLNGLLTAKGTTVSGGSGAGGGVNITAGTIAGTPTGFDVSGGDSSVNYTSTGAGGGGCALLTYTNSNTISPTSSYFSMSGGGVGNRGGAGIVYIKKIDTNGDLYAINSGSSGASTVQSATSLTVNSFTIRSSTAYAVSSGKTLNLVGNSPFSTGDGTGSITIQSGGTFEPNIADGFTISNTTLQINEGSTFVDSSNADIIITSGAIFSQGSYTTSSTALSFRSITIQNGGILTHPANTTLQSNINKLSLVSLTVDSGGTIYLDGKGYSGGIRYTIGNGPGAGGGSVSYGGGAGHGGAGSIIQGGGTSGESYCSSTNPNTIGSGGGGGGSLNSVGGSGGGLLVANISGTFTLNGTLTAKGLAGNAGGGAGGGVNIAAETIVGTPSAFSVAGANTSYAGGGGGCVFLSYWSGNSITSAVVARNVGSGGTGGGAGTYNTTHFVNSYTLTYNAGANGTITGTTPQTVDSGSDGSAVTAVPDTGYHFVNWSDAITTNPRTDTNVVGNITVSAAFAINTSTVSFNNNGGSTEADPTTLVVNYGGNVGTLPTAPTRVGYTFSGWNTVANGSGTTFGVDTVVNDNIVVYAQWTNNSYTLTYNAGANGSITGTTIQTVGFGADGSAVTAVPATGYHFVNWSDALVTNPRTDTNITADITVSAAFVINTSTVTFNKNGGGTEANPTTKIANYNNNVGTLPTAPTRSMYDFNGWNTAANGSGSTFDATTAVTQSMTVYARWEVGAFTLSYNAGVNGSITGDVSQTINRGSNGSAVVAVPAVGYHFVSWSDGVATATRVDTNIIANKNVTAGFVANITPNTYQASFYNIPTIMANTAVADVATGSIGSSMTSTSRMKFKQRTKITNGDYNVDLPANVILTAKNSENQEVQADFTAMVLTTSSVSTVDLPVTPLGAVKYGFDDKIVTLSTPIDITMDVGTENNGKTFNVYRKSFGESTWTLIDTCLVSSGLCVFQTSQLSDFGGGEGGVGAPEFSTWVYIIFMIIATWLLLRQIRKNDFALPI